MTTSNGTDSNSSKQATHKGRAKNERTGLRYGRLIARADVGRSKNGDVLWECECDCGNIVTVSSSNLGTGNTLSCGCLQQERLKASTTKHGKTRTHVYVVWMNMRRRCSDPKSKSYLNYGARGIKVCERWQSFENFYADMGDPEAGHTIDRIDVNGDYEPANCRWATSGEQSRNRRNNHTVTFEGRTLTLIEWSEVLSIPYYTLHARFRRNWSVERAFTTGVGLK